MAPHSFDVLFLPKKSEIEIEMNLDDPRLANIASRELLGAILSQAMKDGMSAVRLGIAKNNDVFMEYFGTCGETTPTGWKMIPPPLAAYVQLLRTIFGLTTFSDEFPLRGAFMASRNDSQVEVMVSIDALERVTLNWKS